jgi:hypothetical protein
VTPTSFSIQSRQPTQLSATCAAGGWVKYIRSDGIWRRNAELIAVTGTGCFSKSSARIRKPTHVRSPLVSKIIGLTTEIVTWVSLVDSSTLAPSVAASCTNASQTRVEFSAPLTGASNRCHCERTLSMMAAEHWRLMDWTRKRSRIGIWVRISSSNSVVPSTFCAGDSSSDGVKLVSTGTVLTFGCDGSQCP